MQTKKCSVTNLVAMALCALVFAFALALPTLQNDAKDVESVSAAAASVSITFSGFDKANNTVNNVVAGIKPYAVVTFIGTNGAVDTHLITANGTVSPTSGFTAIGKIEVNYPMYSTISGGTKETVGTGASFASYYSTSGTLSLTITFSDKGWFAGTTII